MLHQSNETSIAWAVDECRFAILSDAVLRNGYFPIPVARGTKQTRLRNWSKWCSCAPSFEIVAKWAANRPDDGVALACGNIIVIDIDETDPSRAAELKTLAIATLGATPFERVGKAPKVALFYRVESPKDIVSAKIGRVDLLCRGRYVMAFGIHPNTGLAYRWAGPTPATMPRSDLPVVDPSTMLDLIAKLRAYYGVPVSNVDSIDGERSRDRFLLTKTVVHRPQADPRWTVDDRNRVVDGRDAYLTARVYAAFAAGFATVDEMAASAWRSFLNGADLVRPKRDGKRPWTLTDAKQKATALLRSGKPRPTTFIDETSGIWTDACRQAFLHTVDRDAANGLLAPSTVAVSRAMLAYASGRNGTAPSFPPQ